MPTRPSKKQIDDVEITNSIAQRIVKQATGEAAAITDAQLRSQAAAILGKLGASKGGKARAANLSNQRKHQIAKAAAEARWKKPSV